MSEPEGMTDGKLYEQHGKLKVSLEKEMELWAEQTVALEEMQHEE